jgi:hypothetical protein
LVEKISRFRLLYLRPGVVPVILLALGRVGGANRTFGRKLALQQSLDRVENEVMGRGASGQAVSKGDDRVQGLDCVSSPSSCIRILSQAGSWTLEKGGIRPQPLIDFYLPKIFVKLAFRLGIRVKSFSLEIDEEGGKMGKKCLYVLSALLLVFALTSCTSKPEKSLLSSYFHAIMLNDVTTMSTMALEPMMIEAESWKITSPPAEKVEEAYLPGLNKMEMELKKKMEDHVGPTLDAKDQLDNAKDELRFNRSAAMKKRVADLQVAYDKILEEHKQLQKDYNDAHAAAVQEENITKFSLGAGEIANARDLTGEVHSKQVEVAATKGGQAKNYRFYIRQYILKDVAANIPYRGRWIITRIEPIL